MKKIIYLVVFIFNCSCFSWGQSVNWIDTAVVDTFPGSPVVATLTDNFGNVYVAGTYQYHISFDTIAFNNTVNCQNHQHTYLAKYNSSGHLIWAKQYGTLVDENSGWFVAAMTFDKAGNIIMTGNMRDSVLIDSQYFYGPLGSVVLYPNMFIIKLDTSGNITWVKATHSYMPGEVYGISITSDNSNNLYIVGNFTDSLHYGSYTMPGIGEYGAFVAKFDSAGNIVWAKQVYSPNNEQFSESSSIAYTPEGGGSIDVLGDFIGDVIIGADTLHSYYIDTLNYSENIFLAKYDLNGNVIWAEQSTTNSETSFVSGEAVTCDMEGNVYIAGSIRDTAQFGTHIFYGVLDTSTLYVSPVFLVKYDTSGNIAFAEISSGYSYANVTTLFHDNHDNIYWEGLAVGDSLNFSLYKSALNGASTSDGFIIKFNTNGDALCGMNIADREYIAGSGDTSGKYINFSGNLESLNGDLITEQWVPCIIADNIPQVEDGDVITVFPNPSSGIFTFRLSNNEQRIMKIEVFDMLGEKVYSQSYQPSATSYQLNLSNQPNGIYFYRVLEEDGSLIGEGKVVVEK